jgi:hypothetical protein
MKLIQFLFEKGHLTSRGADTLGVMGVAIIWGAAYFFEKWSGFWFWALALLGGALGYIGAYGGLAKTFGFSAPFTNDPLGWRKAKKSYQPQSPESSSEDQAPKP